jgi:transcriptional regulator with XRE-family HTH domain
LPLCTSEKIAELRKTKGMSQQTLADVLFVSRSLVAMWEAGARVPDSVSVERMAELFGVLPEDIMNDSRYAYVSRLENDLIDSEFEDFTDSGSAPCDTERAERIIESFLRKIGKRDKDLFMSRYFSMKTCKAIADEFGMSLSSVKVKLSKIRKKLKRFIETEESK